MSETVERTLGRIEGKLDTALKVQEQHHSRLNNHGERIAKREQWDSRLIGGGAVLGFLIGVAAKMLS